MNYFVFIAFCMVGHCLGAMLPVCKNRTVVQIYQWSVVYFDTPAGYKFDPSYRPTNTFITGVDSGADKMFLTSPRSKTLAPATLSWVPLSFSCSTASPLLMAYPSLEWNTLNGTSTDCNSTLVSVQRTAVDSCNRLWVIDCGVVLNLVKPVTICPPKIVIFDTKTNEMVRVIQVPGDVLRNNSILQNIRLDNVMAAGAPSRSCDDTFAYLADTPGRAVIVYRSPGDIFYRISHSSMYPDHDHYDIVAEGEVFHFFQGVLGMDVGGEGVYRRLYYQPPASETVSYIPTAFLQRGPVRDDTLIPVGSFKKSSPSTGVIADSTDGCVMFNLISQGAVLTWNPITAKQSPVISNSPLIKVMANYNQVNRTTTLAVSVRTQKYFLGTVNTSEINIRIVAFFLNL